MHSFVKFTAYSCFLFLYIVGCQNTAHHNDLSEGRIVHVVLIWLKEPGNESHMNRVIEATQGLKKISEIQRLQVGKSIASERAIVDDSFDIGLYQTFNSIESLENYLTHPIHKETVKSVIAPLSEKILVYDFQE